MRFPFSIKRTIVLDWKKTGISSEGYILNHIEEFMDQFGMMKRRDEDKLFYLNQDPFQGVSRSKRIRNISYEVKVFESEVRIILESVMVLGAVISGLVILTPVVLLFFGTQIYSLSIIGIAIYALAYGLKFVFLDEFRVDVERIIRKL